MVFRSGLHMKASSILRRDLARHQIGMQDPGHQLDAVDHPRTRAAVVARRVNHVDTIIRERGNLAQLRDGVQNMDFLESPIDPKAAWHDDGHFGSGSGDEITVPEIGRTSKRVHGGRFGLSKRMSNAV